MTEQQQDWTAYIPQVIDTLAATYHGRGSVELGEPFMVLIATVISQRTREEQTASASARLFARYPDAATLADAAAQDVQELIYDASYPETKAPRLIEIARILVEKHGGQVPRTQAELLELPGVGPKTANCVLLYAYQIPALCVDVHMHRISNRLGWVQTQRPEQSEAALAKIVPHEYWPVINRLMLQHGRAICQPGVPRCSACPVRAWCSYGNTPGTPKR